MKWIDALKQFNSTRDKWIVPKKETPEYQEVVKIMNSDRPSTPVNSEPVKKVKKMKEPKQKLDYVDGDIQEVKDISETISNLNLGEKKVKKVRKKKEEKEPVLQA